MAFQDDERELEAIELFKLKRSKNLGVIMKYCCLHVIKQVV